MSGVSIQLTGACVLRPCMKLYFTNAEVGMRNAEGWSRYALSFFKIDRIPPFDTCPLEEDSLFDIRFFKVSFTINRAAPMVSG